MKVLSFSFTFNEAILQNSSTSLQSGISTNVYCCDCLVEQNCKMTCTTEQQSSEQFYLELAVTL